MVPVRSTASTIRLVCALLIAMAAFANTAVAAAAPASITVADLEPSLVERDDGSASVEIAVVNQTDGEITLTATAKDKVDCQLGLGKTRLAAAASSSVTVLVPASCKPGDGVTVELTTTAGATPSQTLPITPKVTSEEAPDWTQLLYGFGGALILASLIATSFFFGGWKPEAESKRRLGQRLGALEDTWKFNDNWATNVTTLGALLTGLFGATTATAFLGEDAESLVALATVGAAIALLFVGAAPILALATRSFKAEEGEGEEHPEGAFTVGGILVAATLILASAGGELWVGAYTARELGLQGVEEALVWIAFGFAVLLLLTYSLRSLKDTFQRGTKSEAVEEPNPEVEIEAAVLIVKAIEAASQDGEARERSTRSLGATLKKARRTNRRRPRSALI